MKPVLKYSMSARKIPKNLQKHFWDVNFSKLDKDKNEFLIIKRILDRGNTSDIQWLLSQYGEEKIIKVLTTTRDLSRITANFWMKLLDIPANNVPCLQKPYSRTRFGLSS
jgi:hypothetical protein